MAVLHIGPGTFVDRYTVIERTGRSTTAEVFRARDTRVERDVALKVMEGASEQGRREAKAVATLVHPNIVATLDVLEYDGRLCLVQEWVAGGSLEGALGDRGTLGLEETLGVGRDVASALAHAHGVGILHRDIKPSNVMRSADGSWKLVDFGAVGRLEADSGATREGEIAGTPLYMAPEQFQGARQTAATDLYGLGLLLLRCLHGQVPGGGSGNFIELYRSRTEGPVAVPASPLQALLRRCLAAEPPDRPQSAAAVLQELDAIAAHLAPSATPAQEPAASPVDQSPVPVPVPEPAATGSTADVPPPPVAPLPPVRPMVIGVAVVLAAVGAATVAWAVSASAGGAGRALAGLLAGLAVAGAGLALASRIRRRWSSAEPEAERRAADIVLGAGAKGDLTTSLVIEVEQVVRNLGTFDARFLGMTIVAMIREFEEGKESSDRQAALLNVVSLMEKLRVRFSPWHVRHKDAIALGVAVAGCLAGVGSMISGFVA